MIGKSGMKKMAVFDMLNIAFFVLVTLIMIFPFWNVLMISIVDHKVYVENSLVLFPSKLDLGAYRFIFSTSQIINSLKISVFITILGACYNMLLTISMGYALSIKNLPGRKGFITFVLIPFFFTGGLIPMYMNIKNLGLTDTLAALIIPLGINGWYLIIVKNYFGATSNSLREAAKIDGANDIVVLVKIILPISKAMIATFLLFYGVERWNEWFFAMLFINDPDKIPMQKLLRDIIYNFAAGDMAANYRKMTGSHVRSIAVKMAVAVVTVVPIVMVYPFLQKYFVQGVTSGSVKG